VNKPITYSLYYNDEYRDRFVTNWEEQVYYHLIVIGEQHVRDVAGPLIDNNEIIGWWKVEGL
jgi:hypothetical protein